MCQEVNACINEQMKSASGSLSYFERTCWPISPAIPTNLNSEELHCASIKSLSDFGLSGLISTAYNFDIRLGRLWYLNLVPPCFDSRSEVHEVKLIHFFSVSLAAGGRSRGTSSWSRHLWPRFFPGFAEAVGLRAGLNDICAIIDAVDKRLA